MNPWKGLKNLPHNMWVLFAATLINRSGTMVLPFLALYLTHQLKMSEGKAGFILASYGIGALLTAPFVGKLADYIGSMKVMKFSLIFTGLVLFVYPVFNGFIFLIAATLIFSIINEAFRPANLALITQVVPPEQRKVGFALNRLAINLGMSIGPLAGGFLTLFNYSIIFYVNAVMSIVAGVFLIFSRWDKLPESELSPGTGIAQPASKFKFAVISDKKLLIFVLGMVPVCMVFFQHMSTMPLFVVDYLGYTTLVFGSLSAINTVMIIFIEVPLNNAMRGWSDKKSMVYASLLTAIGFGSMAFARDMWGLAITIVIWTFGEMILFPASATYIADIAPPEKRGEYMGFFQMTFSLGFTLGPWVGMQVYQHTGPVTLWVVMFFLGILSLLIFSRLPKKHLAVEVS